MSAAAAELCITVSAISRHVRILEKHLGTELLLRDRRGIRPTETGCRLQQGLEAAFTDITTCVEIATLQRLRNQINIFAPPMFAAYWLIPRLDRFEQLCPETSISIEDKWTCSHVIPPGADLIIEYGRRPGDREDHISERLTVEEIFPVCDVAMGRRVAENSGLSGITLLHRRGIPRSANWPSWVGFAKATGLNGIDGSRSSRYSTALIMEATRAGRGLLLTNTTVAHDDLAAGRLVRPIAQSMSNDCGYWLLAARAQLNMPRVVSFRAWLLDELAACSRE